MLGDLLHLYCSGVYKCVINQPAIFPFRFVSSARQLAKALEVPLVNDLGYTKRYVRCLQVICLFSTNPFQFQC